MTLKITVRVQYSYVVPCIFWYVSLHFKTDNKQKSWISSLFNFKKSKWLPQHLLAQQKLKKKTFVWFLLCIRDLLEPLHIWRRSFWPSQSKTSVVSKVWHRSYSGRNERQGSDGGVVGEWHADFFFIGWRGVRRKTTFNILAISWHNYGTQTCIKCTWLCMSK